MRRQERGLTLIEILLALIVMVLGIIGILALFPVAMDASKNAMETTQGAILSESVANSIATACRYAYVNTAGTSPHHQLTVNHDSIASTGGTVYYQFLLPNFADDSASTNSGTTWFHHPAASPPALGSPSTGKPDQESEWRLAGDVWTKAQHDQIKGTGPTTGTDGSEVLNQFAYSFDVRKVNTLEYLMLPQPGGQPPVYTSLAQLEPAGTTSLVRVWEVRIHAFRMAGTGASGTGTTTGGGPGGSTKRHISTCTTRITVR